MLFVHYFFILLSIGPDGVCRFNSYSPAKVKRMQQMRIVLPTHTHTHTCQLWFQQIDVWRTADTLTTFGVKQIWINIRYTCVVRCSIGDLVTSPTLNLRWDDGKRMRQSLPLAITNSKQQAIEQKKSIRFDCVINVCMQHLIWAWVSFAFAYNCEPKTHISDTYAQQQQQHRPTKKKSTHVNAIPIRSEQTTYEQPASPYIHDKTNDELIKSKLYVINE